jgi:hypothetical protein
MTGAIALDRVSRRPLRRGYRGWTNKLLPYHLRYGHRVYRTARNRIEPGPSDVNERVHRAVCVPSAPIVCFNLLFCVVPQPQECSPNAKMGPNDLERIPL